MVGRATNFERQLEINDLRALKTVDQMPKIRYNSCQKLTDYYVDQYQEHCDHVDGADYDDGARAEAEMIAAAEEDYANYRQYEWLAEEIATAQDDYFFHLANLLLREMEQHPEYVTKDPQ